MCYKLTTCVLCVKTYTHPSASLQTCRGRRWSWLGRWPPWSWPPAPHSSCSTDLQATDTMDHIRKGARENTRTFFTHAFQRRSDELTQRGQHVPQVVFADDAISVLVNDCEGLERKEGNREAERVYNPKEADDIDEEGATGRLRLLHTLRDPSIITWCIKVAAGDYL